LNEAGIRNKRGGLFAEERVKRLRKRYKIRRKDSNVGQGEADGRIGAAMVAEILGLQPATINKWCRKGLFDATRRHSHDSWRISLPADDITRLQAIAHQHSKNLLSNKLKVALADYDDSRAASRPMGAAI